MYYFLIFQIGEGSHPTPSADAEIANKRSSQDDTL